MTAFLFMLNVVLWGFTWIAISVQIDETPADIALLYRMALASVALFAILAVSGRLHPVARSQQPYLMLTGACLFSMNYIFVYNGAAFIASGVVALIFSTATVFNALNGMIFFREGQTARFVLGASCGMAGLACLFWRDLVRLDLDSSALIGAGLVLAGTYIFSLGNMASRRNNTAGIHLPTAIAWSMVWGVAFLAIYTLAQERDYPLDLSWDFYLALIYLAIPGTVIGFLTYLEVVRRIGASLAAFSTVLYPVIALTVSTFFEDYQWSLAAVIGLALIALGNMLVFAPARLMARWRRASRKLS